MTYQFGREYSAGDEPVTVSRPLGRSPSLYSRFTKRALDLLIVVIALVPVLAVLGLLAVIVALDGHAPFYEQNRIGRGGKLFRLYKLRTMVPDADAVLERTLMTDPAARAEWDKFQKLKNDPRITRIGLVLRKCSLDELPQLINVALGQMSIVGPRPIMDSQRELYPGSEYYFMRPGITGFWQISVRNESSFAERAEYDRKYFEAMSLRTDLHTIVSTFAVVVKGTGV